ncbi:MAG: hypothetical protein ABI746_05500 [Dermatophilaceae bacterium]
MRVEFQAPDGSRVRVLHVSIHDPRRNNPRYVVLEEGLLGETTTPDQPGFDRTHTGRQSVAIAVAKAVARDSATSALLVAHRAPPKRPRWSTGPCSHPAPGRCSPSSTRPDRSVVPRRTPHEPPARAR